MEKKAYSRHIPLVLTLMFSMTVCNGIPFISDFLDDTHEITVDNTTNQIIYGAVYHVSLYSTYAKQSSETFALPQGNVLTVTAPSRSIGTVRKLFVSNRQEDIDSVIAVKKDRITDSFVGVNIGDRTPLKVVADQGRVHIFSEARHATHKKVLDERHAYEQKVGKNQEHVEVARYLGRASQAEQEYITKRRATIKKALHAFTGKRRLPKRLPRISLCGSSGGMRAFLTTIGVLRGLSKIGLLDALEYTSGVSGGSWAILFWLAENTDLQTFVERLKKRLVRMPVISDLLSFSNEDVSTVRKLSSTYRKKIFRLYGHRTHPIMTLYATFISYFFLREISKDHLDLKLSQLAENLDPTRHPLPIGAAVTPHHLSNQHFHWLEFSPFDVRFIGGGYTIPSWAFMRRFARGQSINYMPEPFLGYVAGLLGSFFSASFEDFLTKSPIAAHTEFLGRQIAETGQPAAQETTAYNKKRFAATVPNFVFKMEDVPEALAEKDYIKIVDGAHANSIPVATFLHAGRQQDIIIIANASDSGFLDYQAIRKTRQLLKKYYPTIGLKTSAEEGADEHELDRILGQPFTYIPSTGPGIPSILHITLHPVDTFDPSYDPVEVPETKIINPRYTLEQSERLMGLCEHIVVKNKAAFMDAVNTCLAQR